MLRSKEAAAIFLSQGKDIIDPESSLCTSAQDQSVPEDITPNSHRLDSCPQEQHSEVLLQGRRLCVNGQRRLTLPNSKFCPFVYKRTCHYLTPIIDEIAGVAEQTLLPASAWNEAFLQQMLIITLSLSQNYGDRKGLSKPVIDFLPTRWI